MVTRLSIQVILLISIANLTLGQWQWAHLSGDLTSYPYDSEIESSDVPPGDTGANVWATASGDLWVLRNRRDKSETNFWRWDSSSKRWTMIMSSAQKEVEFVAPPKPDNFGQEADPLLFEGAEDYEEAERRAAAEAQNRALFPLLKRTSRQANTLRTTSRQEQDATLPEARIDATLATDIHGGRLFMFDGRGGISTERGDMLWMYNVWENKWTLLSGANIDFGNMCSVQGSRQNPWKGPCVISAGVGYSDLTYYEGKIYLTAQERTNGESHSVAVWCFDLDGDRQWSFLGAAGNGNGPKETSFTVHVQSFAYDNGLFIYRPLQIIGLESKVYGEIWKFNLGDNSWSSFTSPAVPLENAVSWVIDGLLVTHMPGDIRGGVAGDREVPNVDGWADPWEAERLVVMNLSTGYYSGVQKKVINGMEMKRVSEKYAQGWENTPGRRYGAVGGGHMVGDGLLYMYGGSLENKRNLDQRNDLWACKINLPKLRAAIGL